MPNTYHNPHDLPLRSGITYWAGYMKTQNYPSKAELVVVPLRLEGEEPFFQSQTPRGIYANEWWLLSIANPPAVKAITDEKGVMTGVQLENKFSTYPETHAFGFLSLENLDLVKQNPCDLGIQIADDGRVWLCVNGVSLVRFSPHKDGLMAPKKEDE